MRKVRLAATLEYTEEAKQALMKRLGLPQMAHSEVQDHLLAIATEAAEEALQELHDEGASEKKAADLAKLKEEADKIKAAMAAYGEGDPF